MPALNILHNCATIQLTKGLNTLVDADDYPELSRFRWRVNTGKTSPPYAAHGNRILMHRAILGAMMGPIPPGIHCDHISGDSLDNRRSNLRLATQGENMANTRRRGVPSAYSSRFKGVYWDTRDRKWRAQIRKNGKVHRLGRFIQEEDAADAYDRAATLMFGAFARINARGDAAP